MSIEPVVYRGLDAVKIFLNKVQKLKVLIKQMLKNRIAREEHKHYKEAKTCWICEEAGFDNNKKVCINQKAYCLACATNKGYQSSEYIEDL